MKNLFDLHTTDELSKRISSLTADSHPQWGKMNAYQMLKHCSETVRSSFGERVDKRPLISYLFGPLFLKKLVKDDKPLGKNGPTHPAFVVLENGDFEGQKKILLSLLQQYPAKDQKGFEGRVHPFFGKMTAAQYSILDYKHLDHHFRQFGV